ncbi:hypothetical protein, partial [Pseudomonas amygdali]|uniref:hypothetical protein n=1 Tax=Pseudomonas amygdali TaxID=47877 RepID=UPI001CA4ADD3
LSYCCHLCSPLRTFLWQAVEPLPQLQQRVNRNGTTLGVHFELGFVRKVGGGRIAAMIGWMLAWQSVTKLARN